MGGCSVFPGYLISPHRLLLHLMQRGGRLFGSFPPLAALFAGGSLLLLISLCLDVATRDRTACGDIPGGNNQISLSVHSRARSPVFPVPAPQITRTSYHVFLLGCQHDRPLPACLATLGLSDSADTGPQHHEPPGDGCGRARGGPGGGLSLQGRLPHGDPPHRIRVGG